MEAEKIDLKRAGQTTTVTVDGQYAGSIMRSTVSNSSPRGGAYRTAHFPVLPNGLRLGMCYTRKEALGDILRHYRKAQQ